MGLLNLSDLAMLNPKDLTLLPHFFIEKTALRKLIIFVYKNFYE